MKFKSHVLAAFIFFFASGVLDFANGDEFDFEVLASIKDMHKGTPASNIPVTLYKLTNNDEWTLIGKGYNNISIINKSTDFFLLHVKLRQDNGK